MAGDISVRVIKNDFPKLIRNSPREVDQAIRAMAIHGQTIVKLSMHSSPASGNTYGAHTAASPGNPPRPDTATLVNSIAVERVRRLAHRIFTQVVYAAILEFGSARWANGVMFPFMGPMALELEDLVEQFFEHFLE